MWRRTSPAGALGETPPLPRARPLAGLAVSAASPRVMHLDAHSHAGPVPNLKKLKVLDAYFAWLREEAKKRQAN